ncbi:hypothetical protein KAR91_17005 [Candidatus Pacearchaeota archaeon]|nr:hypothetical protein [Candidatus Pacearchaeota archaeon]
MKTAITRETDGYKVVLGIGDLLIDAVATRMKVAEIVKNDPLTLKAAKRIGKANHLLKEYFKASRAKKRRLAAKAQTLWEQFNLEMAEIAKLRKEVDKKQWELFNANPVYFTPRPGEEPIPNDSELIGKFPLKKGFVLLSDGSEIVDNRGMKYWAKKKGRWDLLSIEKLGEKIPKKAALMSRLTNKQQSEIREQAIQDRILKMSDNDKKTAVKNESDSALTHAAIMKNKLEITNHEDPAGESRRWYKKELKQIEKRYA